MKKQNKTKRYILVALTLFLGLGVTQAFATPGDTISPLIHKGAGAQITSNMQLGGSTETSALLDINEPGKNSVFDGLDVFDEVSLGMALDSQSFMTVLGNSWFQDMVFIGKNRAAEFAFSPALTFPADVIAAIPTHTKSNSALTAWTTDIDPGAGTITATLQKMNIFGGILSTDMNTAAGNATGDAQVCVDAFGKLVMC